MKHESKEKLTLCIITQMQGIKIIVELADDIVLPAPSIKKNRKDAYLNVRYLSSKF